jgi:hypothetical protein
MENIARELRAWYTTGLHIAIWGGAGEPAAFLQAHGVDDLRFPVIISPTWLMENPVDIIVIPCRSQADEIVRAIDKARIPYEGILIPDEGRLVDFHAAEMMFA